jgi:alcohol dehydrogenase
MLFKNVQSGKLDPKKLITHRFKLEQIIQAYNTFEHASKEKALKIILTN